MSGDDLINGVKTAYYWLNGMETSTTTLLGVAALFCIAGLLAAREALAWFLKVDDLKRHVRKLEELSLQLHGEVRVVQNLLQQSQAMMNARDTAAALSSLSEPVELHIAPISGDTPSETPEDVLSADESAAAEGPTFIFEPNEKRPGGGAFPISH